MTSKIFSSLIISFFSFCSVFAQKPVRVSPADFKNLLGMWQGSLTYLDYSSGKPYTMGADIDIKQIGTSNNFIFSNTYPKEPGANSVDTMIISKNGKMINGNPVKSKRLLDNGNTELTTEVLNTDGNHNKPAALKHTYIIGKNIYVNRKEVRFTGQKNWIKRNEYKYTRKTL